MATNEESDGQKLGDIFDKIWALYEELEKSCESTNSDSVQNLVSSGIGLAEKAVHMVNELNLFSKNENIDEVASCDIRYMLLPALLGYFTNKNVKIDRFDAVCKAQVYYVDFVRLCKLYELADCELPKLYVKPSESGDQTQAMAHTKSGTLTLDEQMKKREKKIEQLKRRRQLEQTLSDLTQYVKQEHADEEHVRRFYLTLVNKWLADTFEHLESIEGELPILEHMAKMKERGLTKPDQSESTSKVKPATMRPFIITKNEVQKKVFGLGYPGIPTLTVDEFYDQRVREGLFPPAEHSSHSHGHHHGASAPVRHDANADEEEAKQRENKAELAERNEENEDEESLQRQRAWDDWRDDHRRGWGNTHNKG